MVTARLVLLKYDDRIGPKYESKDAYAEAWASCLEVGNLATF